jgi:hypothetical protein
MLFALVIHHYLLWHYGQAFGQIRHLAKNFWWFTIHFFSLPQLFRSLLSPWRRITTERGSRFNLEDLAGYLIVNLISRIIGTVLRSVIILLGLLVLVALLLGTLTLYLAWILAPFLIIANLYLAIKLLVI